MQHSVACHMPPHRALWHHFHQTWRLWTSLLISGSETSTHMQNGDYFISYQIILFESSVPISVVLYQDSWSAVKTLSKAGKAASPRFRHNNVQASSDTYAEVRVIVVDCKWLETSQYISNKCKNYKTSSLQERSFLLASKSWRLHRHDEVFIKVSRCIFKKYLQQSFWLNPESLLNLLLKRRFGLSCS